MAELKITDLVDEQEIEKLKQLASQLEAVKKTYSDAAKELAKGLKINVESVEELEKLQEILSKQFKKTSEQEAEAEKVTKQYQEALKDASEKMRERAATQEKLNKLDETSLKNAQKILGSRQDNIKLLAKYEKELASLSSEKKKLQKAEKAGTVSEKEAISTREHLLSRERELKTAKQDLTKTLNIEEKMTMAASGSYENLSQTLEYLKRAYKSLNDEEKKGEIGKNLSDNIQFLDSHLKKSASSMGEFQRNVGNYALAANNGAEATEKLVGGLSDMLGISGNLGSSLKSLALSPSGSFMENLTTKTKAFGKSLLTMLSNPSVIAFLGIGGAAATFKWIYDYNKGLQESTRITKQLTGASGNEMKAYRNEVQALADMFGKDFQETLISVNTVAKRFDITFAEALDNVKDGFLAGADVNGEFLDNLKEYPAYFKEAGISASEFIAITTQANQQGIYSDKGIDTIKEANIRIREMTKATRDALDGIGISSDKVQRDLRNGSKTTFDVMKEVSEKLSELPESSSAVGTAIADIFGGPGEDAGLEYIKTLKDIDTNLDNVKGKAGELGKLQEEQLQSEIELQNTISSLFDFTGGSFEGLTTKVKIFVNESLSGLIKGFAKLCNYFISLYNDSTAIRTVVSAIVADFKILFSVVSEVAGYMIDQFKALGKAIHGIFTLNLDEIEQAWKDAGRNTVNLAKGIARDSVKAYNDAIEASRSKIKPITIESSINVEKTEKSKKKGKREGNKDLIAESEERKKIIAALKQSEVDLMDEGYLKERETIKNNFANKIAAIKGNSKEELETKANLLKLQEKTLEKYDKAYNEERLKTDIANRLAAAEKGSEDEYRIKLASLMQQERIETEQAVKTGADINAIHEKYRAEEKKLNEEYAQEINNKIQESYSSRQAIRDAAFKDELSAIKQRYADGLISEEEYEKEKDAITLKYASESGLDSISMLEEQLKTENLNADERKKIEEELAKAKADLSDKVADAEIDAQERIRKADKDTQQERIENLKTWLSSASETINAVRDLANALFEGQLQKLDEESEANQDSHDDEIERIQDLEDNGAISKEEAEARKRAAEDRTAQKEADIDKKRRKIQYKQAIWEKATSLAQTGIQTALGIMSTIAKLGFPAAIPFIAMVSALGAIQAATIIATPIPKYAKGTKDHPGGLAIVGDAGKSEAVLTDEGIWTTPAVPTLVDLPKHAAVLPDSDKLDDSITAELSKPFYFSERDQGVTVINDYSKLEKQTRETNNLLRAAIKQAKNDSAERDLKNYMNDKQ